VKCRVVRLLQNASLGLFCTFRFSLAFWLALPCSFPTKTTDVSDVPLFVFHFQHLIMSI